jgi:peptidoglycan hydrolase CwlO-like protein
MEKTIDKYNLKITIAMAITVIIFMIIISYQTTTWKSRTDNKIENLENYVSEIKKDINSLEDKSIRRDIELATINTKLVTIETLLLEIRQDLKKIQEKD